MTQQKTWKCRECGKDYTTTADITENGFCSVYCKEQRLFKIGEKRRETEDDN